MSVEPDFVGIEGALADALAPHVEGPILLAAAVRVGPMDIFQAPGYGVQTGGWLMTTILRYEKGLPKRALLAVTPSDVYLFASDRRDHGPPRRVRRWPRATLRDLRLKQRARLCLMFRLESGKKIILRFLPTESSRAVRERAHTLFARGTEELPAPNVSESRSEPTMAAQSEEFSRLVADAYASYPWLEPGETARCFFREMPPLPLMFPPLIFLGWPLFRLIRGSRTLWVTDRNLYVVRGSGAGMSVLYKAQLGSVRVTPRGDNLRGRYLEIADQRIWQLGPPETMKNDLVAANGG
jgi:hypothetical protein